MQDSTLISQPGSVGEIRILDDDAEVLNYLLRVVREISAAARGYENPDEFLEAPADPPPACLIVDWQLRGRDGLEVIAQCQQKWPDSPVILISGHATVPVAVTAMRQGVVSVIEKPVRPTELVREVKLALETAQARQAESAESRDARRRLQTLTEVEMSILKFVVNGTPNKNMATQLGLATRTIEKYRSTMFVKLGVESAAEATRVWMLANQ